MDLGLRRQGVRRHRLDRRASASRSPGCCRPRAPGSSPRAAAARGSATCTSPPTSRSPASPSASIGGRARALRPGRLPRQQRRLGRDPPLRRADRGDLGALLAAEPDERRPRDPGRCCRRCASAGRGCDRQRLLDRCEAPVDRHARVLGHQGGDALALPPRRRPVREGRDPLQRRHPGPDRDRRLARRRRARRPAGRPRRDPRQGRRRPAARPARRARGDRRRRRLPLLRAASYVTGAAWSADGGTVPIII